MSLCGAKLAGGSPDRGRADNDFYATNPLAVEKLLLNYDFNGRNFLEPCVGQGHIANAIKKFYINKPHITAIDIVDRGYPNTIVTDFLNWNTDKKFECIITNPPLFVGNRICRKKYVFTNR